MLQGTLLRTKEMAEGHPGEQGPTQMPGCAEQLRDTWNSLALCQE